MSRRSLSALTVCLCSLIGAILVGIASYVGWKLRWSPEYLRAWGNYLSGVAAVFLTLGALYTALRATADYRQKTRLEKAKWLSELYKSFFEEPKFKDIRAKIDYADLGDIFDIIEKDLIEQRSKKGGPSQFTAPQRQLLDSFTDFLNFFEFVGYLGELKQLSSEDIVAMFDYYLGRINEVDVNGKIRDYLKALNFEYLPKLLHDVSNRKK